MRRRAFMALFVPAGKPNTDQFTARFNEWAVIWNAQGPGRIHAREYAMWRDVKARWRELEDIVERFYAKVRK